MIYIDRRPKWVINAETFGVGDGRVIKLCIHDVSRDTQEQLVVQKGLNDNYIILDSINSTMLLSEERFMIFRASYGIDEAEIDFSTFKFRKPAEMKKGKMLL